MMSRSGINWRAICRQITMPAPHHSNFFTAWMLFLMPDQQCQNTEGGVKALKGMFCIIALYKSMRAFYRRHDVAVYFACFRGLDPNRNCAGRQAISFCFQPSRASLRWVPRREKSRQPRSPTSVLKPLTGISVRLRLAGLRRLPETIARTTTITVRL